LLKLQFKTFSELLRYVNFGAVAACRVLCVRRTVFRISLVITPCDSHTKTRHAATAPKLT